MRDKRDNRAEENILFKTIAKGNETQKDRRELTAAVLSLGGEVLTQHGEVDEGSSDHYTMIRTEVCMTVIRKLKLNIL